MKIFKLLSLSFIILIAGSSLCHAQKSPDKFINYLKKEDSSVAVTLPGWFIKLAGHLATKDIDDNESQMIRELTGHIKKLRFVVNETLPADYKERFQSFKSHMTKKGFEPLIEARDDGTTVDLWAEFDGQIVKKIVVSVLEEDNSSVFFNIKSDIDFDKLKSTNFYKDWKNEL